MVEKLRREYLTLRDIKVKYSENSKSVVIKNQDSVFHASIMIVNNMWDKYASRTKS